MYNPKVMRTIAIGKEFVKFCFFYYFVVEEGYCIDNPNENMRVLHQITV